MIKKLLSVLMVALMSLSANAYDLGLDGLYSGWNSSYDPATQTITFDGSYTGRGWWLGEADFSSYTDVVINFQPTTQPFWITVQYANPDGGDAISVSTGACELGDTQLRAKLNPELKGNVIQIYLQCTDITDEPYVTLISAEVLDYTNVEPDWVLFDGNAALDWWPGFTIKTVKVQDTFAEDNVLAISYESADGGAISLQTLNADWSQTKLPCLKNLDNEYGVGSYNAEYGLIGVPAESGVVFMYIDEETVELVNGNIQGLMVVGDGVTVTRVQVIDSSKINFYAVGDFQGWDPENGIQFTVNDDFTYTLALEEEISELKIGTVRSNWAIFDCMAICPAIPLEEGVVTPFEVGKNNIILPWKGVFTITVDPLEETILVKSNTPKPTTEATLYLRGGMNGWGADDAYKFATEDGVVYTLSVEALSAETQWKIADDAWTATTNFGGDGTPYDLNSTYVMVMQGMNCNVAEDITDVKFTFNIDSRELVITGTTGIENVINNVEAKYYNLQGVEVANPQAGQIYIVKRGEKVSKEIRK